MISAGDGPPHLGADTHPMLISDVKLASMNPAVGANYESTTQEGKRFNLEMLQPPVGYVYVGEYERLKAQNDSLRQQVADAEVSIHDRQSSYIRRESEYLQYIDSLERNLKEVKFGKKEASGKSAESQSFRSQMKEIRKMHNKVQVEVDAISNRDAINKARERDHAMITNLRMQLHRLEEQHRQLEEETEENAVLRENVELRNIIDDLKMGSDDLLKHVELRENAAKSLELQRKDLEEDLDMFKRRNVQMKAELEIMKRELRGAADREKEMALQMRQLKDKLDKAEGRIKQAEQASTSERHKGAVVVEYQPSVVELERVISKLRKALEFERRGRAKAEEEHFKHLQSRTALQAFLAEEIQHVRAEQAARKSTLKNADSQSVALDNNTKVSKAQVTAVQLDGLGREARDEVLSRLFAKEEVLTLFFSKAFVEPGPK